MVKQLQEQYGAILRACRLRQGLNQEELAHELHIHQSDVSKIERGIKEPPLSLVRSWALSTQSQEVLVAFLLGLDGLTIMQQVMDIMNSGIVGTFIGGLLWTSIF